MKTVTANDLDRALEALGVDSIPLCLHTSLKSFGHLEGGADTFIDVLLDRGCTLLVPTFTYDYEVSPPADGRPMRNGLVYDDRRPAENDGVFKKGKLFDPLSNDLSVEHMGAVPNKVLSRSGRVRGSHPLNSFTALGPLADELIAGQTDRDVYAPFDVLRKHRGLLLMAGVGLTRMTALHFAEKEAGRSLFVRWAAGKNGQARAVRVGSCSDGFNHFDSVLAPIEKKKQVGESRWRLFPMEETMELAAEAIKENPQITHCSDPDCERCRDAVAGGPGRLAKSSGSV